MQSKIILVNEGYCFNIIFSIVGSIKPLPKKATRNVTMAALLIEEVTRNLANE